VGQLIGRSPLYCMVFKKAWVPPAAVGTPFIIGTEKGKDQTARCWIGQDMASEAEQIAYASTDGSSLVYYELK